MPKLCNHERLKLLNVNTLSWKCCNPPPSFYNILLPMFHWSIPCDLHLTPNIQKPLHNIQYQQHYTSLQYKQHCWKNKRSFSLWVEMTTLPLHPKEKADSHSEYIIVSFELKNLNIFLFYFSLASGISTTNYSNTTHSYISNWHQLLFAFC